ncbi:nucleoside recognition domain-containing protein [Garciella nitratireducens]|uniref:Nucleoside recognition n=1 Tax=Garciella nitratireducens DSM 15102 TaxID=1121911 RepID=A0A1T4K2S6_9FIRM|nr:nucleoside recognition domain-containing protein [Garciella nitratireducens]RBP46633.1 nucleoside recognition protein [Garciella nitratireducens]SJZ36689.1 Nucleoside recognition [Garciella nitratireducens DSM 15102]
MIIALKDGFKKGIFTTWKLTKIIIPCYIIITLLQHTPMIEIISNFFEPILEFLGLPGEAALVLVSGNLINIYAALGVISALNFTMKEIIILSLMLSFSHSLILESAVMKKMGANILKLNTLRIAMSILSGLIVNILW